MATFARIYVGDDGLSHVEDIEPSFEMSADAEGALEATPFSRATEVAFRRSPPGHFQDFHTPPRRQYTVTLSGEIEVTAEDGRTRRFGPGTVLLVEDLHGKGHTTRVVGSEVRVFMVVAL